MQQYIAAFNLKKFKNEFLVLVQWLSTEPQPKNTLDAQPPEVGSLVSYHREKTLAW